MRGTKDCRLGWKSLWLIFWLAFAGATVNQNLYYEGLYLSSSSAASALSNLIPAITYLMAYTLGLETVHARSLRGSSKIFGTVLCVAGAVAMALFKGSKLLNKNIEFLPTNSILLGSNHGQHDTWLLGCLLVLGSAFFWSLWLILQAQATVCYPDHLSLTSLMCLMSALQSGILTLIVEPNTNSWKLNSPFQLISCLYSGVASAVVYFAQAWCIARSGPVFAAMFNPLCTLITTLLACILLHEVLYTGSMVGGLVVIIGLYIVLWGKAKDHQFDTKKETTQMKLQNDQTTLCTQVSDSKIDLEEPLLPDQKSANLGCDKERDYVHV